MNCTKLISTKELNRTDWLKARKQGIGGSDSASVLGLNPWSSPLKVWIDKTEDVLEDIDNERMRVGRDLEEYVAKRFVEATGKQVKRVNYILQNEEHDFMLANLDRVIIGENAFLECKTTNSYAKKDWEDGKIPLHYEVQCMHYMATCGFTHGYIAVLIGNEQFLWYRVDRDEEVIAEIIKREGEFWRENVLKRIPPKADGSDDFTKMLGERYQNATDITIELDSKYAVKLAKRDELNEMIKSLEKQKKQIEQEIQMEMKDAEIAKCGDKTISWKLQERKSVDTARLKADGLYNNYIKVSNSRVFKIR